MRLLKKTAKIVLALLLLLFISGWLYIKHLQPNYEGEIVFQDTTDAVQVYFDEYGIPHIYAQNQEDALRALGYVHAQERLWQMELLKRIAPGKLSTLFGEKTVKTDAFFLTLGIADYSNKIVSTLDKNTQQYRLMEAYLNGVNKFIDEGPTPIEFTILGIKKQHLTILDIYNIIGYMGFSFAQGHKTDPLLSILQDKLGAAYINELGIDVNPKTTLIKNFKGNSNEVSKMVSTVNTILENIPFPSFSGSNSWVVNGAKTSSGKVLFANDPHISFSQPSVWYEAHVVCPDFEQYGYHIAGIPFPLLGHNRNFATGLTMFENDDIDFYAEENNPDNPNLYKTPEGYKEYTKITKTIQIKGKKDSTIVLKKSRHGAIINSVLDSLNPKQPIAMRWIFTGVKNDIINALYTISRATSMQEVKKGASMIHSPGLNVMYGDKNGNIAWWASAKLYKYKNATNRKFILDGASGKNDTIEYLDFSQNPMAENPDWNFVYSANNQPDSINGGLYPGYYVSEDRARRIKTLLLSKDDWTKESFMNMILDTKNPVAVEIIRELVKTVATNGLTNEQKRAFKILNKWDGVYTKDKIAPTIYTKWVYLYLKNTFEDEMGKTHFNQFLKTHLSKRATASQIKKDSSIWWDDVTTATVVESKKDILAKSFIQTVTALEKQLGKDIKGWTWDKVLSLEHNHPLGSVEALRKYFNVGPFRLDGSRQVINNMIFDYTNTGIYQVTGGPSTRRIIDFGDIENSMSILPTGQSGVPFSKYYNDQATMYVEGNFRKMKLNKEEIIKSSTLLEFKPE